MKLFGSRRTPQAPALEWLCDLSGRAVRVTAMGSRALLVENHCGIRSFTAQHIALAARGGCLDVRGSGLCLSEVRRDALIIRGEIQEVRLPCAEARSDEP